MIESIASELLRLGGSTKHLGYQYTIFLLQGLVSGEITTNSIQKGYEIIADQYGCSCRGAERAITRYITNIWTSGSPELRAMFFNHKPTNKEFIATLHKPTNKEFIATLWVNFKEEEI